MKYFEKFPSILYTLDDNRKDFKAVKNIFVKIKLLKEILDNADLFYDYQMKEGDNPWIIAHKLYSDPDRYWMVMFANELIDPYYDPPLQYMSFDNFIADKYGSIANSMSTFSHYEKRTTITTDKNGVIDTQTYTTGLSEKAYDFDTGTIVTNTLPTVNTPILVISTDSTTIPDADGIDVVITTTVEHVYVDAYTQENNDNEAKRTIKLIKPEYASRVEEELKNLLKN